MITVTDLEPIDTPDQLQHNQLITKIIEYISPNVLVNNYQINFDQGGAEDLMPAAYQAEVTLASLSNVINCSWGGGNYTDTYNFNTSLANITQDPNLILIDSSATRIDFLHNVFVIHSAGNNDNTLGPYYSGTWTSNDSPYGINVGALAWSGTGTAPVPVINGQAVYTPGFVANYSLADPRFVNFFADGYSLLSETGTVSAGTSFASPRISADIAQILYAHPNYDFSQVYTVLDENVNFFQTYKNSWWEKQILGMTYVDEHLNNLQLAQDVFAVFYGRNPDTSTYNLFLNYLNTNGMTVDAWHYLAQTSNYNNQQVPLIEQCIGLFHLFLDRDATNTELDLVIQDYGNDGENWAVTCNDFVNYFHVNTIGYSFTKNNYQIIF